jgi:hypothetical protein
MADSGEQDDLILARQEGREALSPWLGWVLGPMAWALHQGVGYAMVPMLCRLGTRWPYHVLTLLALALCLCGALAARHALLRSHRIRPERSHERMKMMARVGLMLCAAATGGIIVEYAASFWIEICASIRE